MKTILIYLMLAIAATAAEHDIAAAPHHDHIAVNAESNLYTMAHEAYTNAVLWMPVARTNVEADAWLWDYSGGTNDGVAYGDASYATNAGGAFEFDGAGDYIDLVSINLGATHTISQWVFLNAFGGVSIGDAAQQVYAGWFKAADTLYYKATRAVSVNPAMTTGTWHNIVFVRSGTSVDFYKDGSQIGTTQTLSSDDDCLITRIGTSKVYYFNGLMNSVELFTNALSPAEVGLIYTNEVGRYP